MNLSAFRLMKLRLNLKIGLLGVLPVDASNELGIRLGRIYKLVRKGVMDLVRVTRYDGSVSLYVPLRSIPRLSGWR